jgi:hypothetical protein
MWMKKHCQLNRCIYYKEALSIKLRNKQLLKLLVEPIPEILSMLNVPHTIDSVQHICSVMHHLVSQLVDLF